jgi:hypothetical protein
MFTDPQWFANAVAVAAALVSGIALCVSGVSVWYARRQTAAAERQANEATASRKLAEKAMADQAEALRRQSEFAERSSEAARRSATAAEESARLAAHSQRAWLTISGKREELYQGIGDGQDQFSLVVMLTNSGQTPATEVVLTQHIRYECPAGAFHEEPCAEVHCPSIGATGETRISSVLKIPTRQQLEEMKRIKHDVEVRGSANYRDVFGELRATSWHYIWDYAQHQFVSEPTGTQLS